MLRDIISGSGVDWILSASVNIQLVSLPTSSLVSE